MTKKFTTWKFPTEITTSTPVFTITPENGFLPLEDPILLPERFKELSNLLEKMSVRLPDGSPGLLATGDFGSEVEKLPLYDVSDIEDQALLMALFRDYTFATSAYLLEPCDILNRQKGHYGQGRNVLPKNLAVPLQIISDKIAAKPFMEYAQSYALYNYKRLDTNQPLDYENIELIRKFSGMEAEHGFVMIHVAMVRHTPLFVKAVTDVLESASVNDRAKFNSNLQDIVKVMKDINTVMEKMWIKSNPSDYIKFRTFIMGTKGQKEMFPNGVLYEGVDTEPKFYRGESGANDSIVPTCDNLLQLTWKMPDNPMTDILRDFRSYRPTNHNEWLTWVDQSAQAVAFANYCESDPVSLALYIQLLDQVRDFRARHWLFAKEYIIKRSAHPVATGGSPMATWLPNQLNTVLEKILERVSAFDQNFGQNAAGVDYSIMDSIKAKAAEQRGLLQKDVSDYVKKYSTTTNSY